MNTPASHLPCPPPLRVGDTIAIAAPARFVDPADLQNAITTFEQWGLKVMLPEGLFEKAGQLAGSDTHRATLMQRLIDDPEVKAIVCARGGYGSVRIVDCLDLKPLYNRPKWIVGYSDATVLHSHLHATLGLPTLHATMPINFPPPTPTPPLSIGTLHDALFGHPLRYAVAPHPLNRAGHASAVVVGGNLSILYSLLGSASSIDTRGKILLIEDLDEYLYHIDRMMQALRRAGTLDGLAGLIVGGMTDMHDNTTPFSKTAHQIVAEAVADKGYPVLFDAPFGHLGEGNAALPLGKKIDLMVSISEKSTIFAP